MSIFSRRDQELQIFRNEEVDFSSPIPLIMKIITAEVTVPRFLTVDQNAVNCTVYCKDRITQIIDLVHVESPT